MRKRIIFCSHCKAETEVKKFRGGLTGCDLLGCSVCGAKIYGNFGGVSMYLSTYREFDDCEKQGTELVTSSSPAPSA